MNASRICKHVALLLMILLLSEGCGVLDLDRSTTRKPSSSGLIATPVTYYSTSRARYLGAKYKENLDRLVERVVRNPKTANLQFANNIASVGGIGFFTHSATKTADERYLEVVLAAPETFDTKGAHSDKVNQLFNSYGVELLAILSGDNDIYQDKELTGYGLNLSWRNVITDPAGNRVTLERAIVYLAKEKTRSFLRREIKQNDLLGEATIFAVEEDGPLNLISYRAPEVRQEYRSAIREDDISPASAATTPARPPITVKTESPDQGQKETRQLKELVAKIAPAKPPVTVTQPPKPLPPKAPAMPEAPAKPAPSTRAIAAPVAARVVEAEAAPAEIAKLEVPGPVSVPVAETNEATPLIKPVARTSEPAHAVLDAPKPPVAPKSSARAVEVAQPPLVESGPRAEPQSPPAIRAMPIEGAAPARVVNPPKPLPAKLKPFLPPAPPVAASVPVPTPPKLQESASVAPVAKPEPKPVAVVSAPPVIEAPARPLAALPPPSAVSPPSSQQPVETPASVPVPIATKSAPPVIDAPARSVVAAPPLVGEKALAKPAAEQLASLPNRPTEYAPAKPAIARTPPKALEGFIIQLAFNDKQRAQHWAEAMEKKGFAVSVTEAGAEGALRVRVGNFVLRDDAERQLRVIKQEGLNGIILNLPQAFRPEVRTSIP